MTGKIGVVLLAGLLLAVVLSAGLPAAADGGAADDVAGGPGGAASGGAAPGEPSLQFLVAVGHSLYPEWREEHCVLAGESFPLGETRYAARVTRFLPDFRFGPDGPTSVSAEWNNPAVQIHVLRDGAVADSSWSFRDFPPHGSQRPSFTFRLLSIDPVE